MGTTVFLHRFHQGQEMATPFKQVIVFLEKYGTSGSAGFENEITFPPDEIADLANVIRDQAGDVLCIAFERALIDAQFRGLVFEAMQQFGFAAYEDSFDWVYVIKGTHGDAVPQGLLDELSSGVQEISTMEELWPQQA